MSRAATDPDLWRTATGLVVLLSREHGREADLLAAQVIADGDAHGLLLAMGYLSLGLAEAASKMTGPALEDLLLTQAAALRECQ